MRRITPRLLVPAVAAGAAVAVAAPGAAGQTPLPTPAVTIQYQYLRIGPVVKFRDIKLKNVPEGSSVVVRCLTQSGSRCGGKLRRAFRAENVGGTIAVQRFNNKRIRNGRSLEATITNPGYRTQYKTLAVRRPQPTVTTECSDPGSAERGPC